MDVVADRLVRLGSDISFRQTYHDVESNSTLPYQNPTAQSRFQIPGPARLLCIGLV